MNFYVGQKVTAINKRGGHANCLRYDYGDHSLIPIIIGEVYTIRSLVNPVYSHDRVVGLRFDGLINGQLWGMEQAYQGDEFRPVVDISIFTAMLTQPPVKEKV